jgi:hypothetical protein
MDLPPMIDWTVLVDLPHDKRPAFFVGGAHSGEPAPFGTPFVVIDGVHHTRGGCICPDGWYAHIYIPTEMLWDDLGDEIDRILTRH